MRLLPHLLLLLILLLILLLLLLLPYHCSPFADGTAVIYDGHHHSTHVTRLSLLPAHVAWHPSSAVCLLASTEGQLQFLDAGLGSLR